MGCETKILVFKAKRVAKGLEITMQSEHLEAFFKGQANQGNGTDQIQNWQNISGYRVNNLQEIPVLLNSWGGPLIQYNGNGINQVNCSMLRAVGLAKGITFTINGLYSDDILNTWEAGLRKAVNELCRQYLTPKEIEFEITTREIV